ncbi:MAG TPA: thioesterase II family protein [Pyrinomonadaceae bacterium]
MVLKGNSVESKWLRSPRPNPQAQLRLFCFPYAGGSDLTFRTWPRELPPDVEVCGVQLPGHGNRLRENSIDRIEPLVAALAPQLLPYLDRPFAFFGHSMGALISFEVARWLRRNHAPKPECLFVSGRPAPQIPDPERRTYDLPEPEFIEELRRLNGTPREVLEHPELLQLMLPIIRADFGLCQNYRYQPETPLDFPIIAYGGTGDVEVSYEQLRGWHDQTSASFSQRMFEGDHFFLISAKLDLLKVLSSELEGLIMKNITRLAANQML